MATFHILVAALLAGALSVNAQRLYDLQIYMYCSFLFFMFITRFTEIIFACNNLAFGHKLT